MVKDIIVIYRIREAVLVLKKFETYFSYPKKQYLKSIAILVPARYRDTLGEDIG